MLRYLSVRRYLRLFVFFFETIIHYRQMIFANDQALKLPDSVRDDTKFEVSKKVFGIIYF